MTCAWLFARSATYTLYTPDPPCSAPATHLGAGGLLCPRHAAAWRRMIGPVSALRADVDPVA